MPVCWATGCQSGYNPETTRNRHFFRAPKDDERRRLWNRKIPRVGVLLSSHSLCDLHFDEQYILKTYDIVVNGVKTSLPRGKWTLTNDAIPSIFPNVPKYLSSDMPKRRRKLCRVGAAPTQIVNPTVQCNIDATDMDDSCYTDVSSHHIVQQEASDVENAVIGDADCNTLLIVKEDVSSNCKHYNSRKSSKHCINCKRLANRLYQSNRKLRHSRTKLMRMKIELCDLQKQLQLAKQKVDKFEQLPKKLQLAVSQNVNSINEKGNRYTKEWILDCLLIKCKSPAAYKFLRSLQYLPLPSVATVQRHVKNLRPEFGFDETLSVGLSEKLKSIAAAEKRGMLMFDEIQLSKHVDFRSDLQKTVGLVDYGPHTQPCNTYQEGDHALVFMFRPHLGSWIQTIGCFCSAGTTPAIILAKLILEAILMLEKCGAQVDGIVSDGASTNRKALSSLGFCGKMNKVCNAMTNPYDGNRKVFFICDVPHLIKTIRNNLLKSEVFQVIAIYFIFATFNSYTSNCISEYDCKITMLCLDLFD